MEETLWKSTNKLRGSLESSEYKHEVLGWKPILGPKIPTILIGV